MKYVCAASQSSYTFRFVMLLEFDKSSLRHVFHTVFNETIDIGCNTVCTTNSWYILVCFLVMFT